jgi:DegV family protein with EDD domain
MSRVSIVTDTIACLPVELVKEYGITVVPIGLVINGQTYRDQMDMTNDEYWQQFDAMKTFTTNASIPGDFIKAFQEAGQKSNDIACVLVSKAMSATLRSAQQAKEILKSEGSKLNIEIVDSKTAAGAEGFVALEGARAARSGKTIAEVIEVMQDMVNRAKWVCGIDTTKYIIKAGRAPKTVPTEIFLQIKPMIAQLHVTGAIEDIGAARNKDECFQKLVDLVGQNSDPGKPLHVIVHYTYNLEDSKRLLKMVQEKYHPVETYLTPYSAVMCGTTGPCSAISFFC